MTKYKPGVASRLAGQSGLVMLGNVFTLLVGFPFQIYLARKLGAEQLGAFGLFEVVAQSVGALFSFGLGFTLVRYIPQHAELGQNRHVMRLLAMVFMVIASTGTVAAILVAVGNPVLLHWMPELIPYAELFPLVAFMTFLGMLTGISQQALRAFFDIRYMIVMSSFLQLTIKVAVTVMLLWLGWELMGYMVAVVVSSTMALIGMLWGIHKHLKRLDRTTEGISKEAKTSWLSYSSIMYGTFLLGVVGAPAERFLLAGLVDLASVGVLMVVRQLQSFPQVFLQIIITVVAPMFVAAKAKDDLEEVKHIYHIATDWVCRLGLPLLLFLLVFGGEVLGIYGPAFAKTGQWPLFLFVAGQVVNLLAGPTGAVLNMLGHEKKMFQLNVISNIIGIGVMLVLMPLFGLVGIAVGAGLSMLYINVAALRIMKKRLGIRWWSARHGRLLMPLGAIMGILVLIKLTISMADVWMLAALLLMTYGGFLGIYAWSGFSSEDKEILTLLRGKLMALGKQGTQ